MCGRITTVEWDELIAAFNCIELDIPINKYPDWPAAKGAYIDAFPRRKVPLLCSKFASEIKPEEKLWGFIPEGHTDVVFNTRYENASSLPLWKSSYENRRCIVPVHAFYESHSNEMGYNDSGRKVKQLYRFIDSDASIMLLGGIWEADRFSIMTTKPNHIVSPIHHRMPVVFDVENARKWLNFEKVQIDKADKLKSEKVYKDQTNIQESLF